MGNATWGDMHLSSSSSSRSLSRSSRAPARKVLGESIVVVALGRFDPLQEIALRTVLGHDCALDLLTRNIADVSLARAAERPLFDVALVGDNAIPPPPSGWPESHGGVVVMAHAPTPPRGMVLLAAGVSCVAWSSSPKDLLGAVHLTTQGGCVFVADDGDRVVRRDRRKERIVTSREMQVLKRLAYGEGNSAIALRLNISRATVKKHVESLLTKLKAASKRELIGLPTEWLT